MNTKNDKTFDVAVHIARMYGSDVGADLLVKVANALDLDAETLVQYYKDVLEINTIIDGLRAIKI